MIVRFSRIAMCVFVLTLSAMAIPQPPGPPAIGDWDIHIVDTGPDDVGAGTSISLDSNGYPHIIYHSQRPDPDKSYFIKYARWNGTDWEIEAVDPDTRVLWCHDLVLDSHDNPHIAYKGSNILKYARRNDTGWNIETVDSYPVVGGYGSIALDSQENPHISYFDHNNKDLRYATKSGGTWTIEVVDSNGFVGWWTSIALDRFDIPHISYMDVSNFKPKYATRWHNGWSTEPIDVYYSGGYHTSLVLDSGDRPHVAYKDSDHPRYWIKLAWNDGAKWVIETVDDCGTSYAYPSLDLDSSDNPRIAYNSPDGLRYAERVGGSWHVELVDDDPIVGREPSLALDADDNPHISYHDQWYKTALRYATKADLGPPPEPVLSISLGDLDFGTLLPGAEETASFEIWNSGDGILTYSFMEDTPWIIEVNPPSGNSTGEHDTINVTVDTTGLSEGLHSGSILIESNGGNGTVNVSVEVIAPARLLTLDIDPDTLNLKSKGRWITAYLSAENASVHDIDVSTVLLQDALAPERWDYQDDVLMLKFSREEFKDTVRVGESVQVKIAGKWEDDTAFEAYDSLRVIWP